MQLPFHIQMLLTIQLQVSGPLTHTVPHHTLDVP